MRQLFIAVLATVPACAVAPKITAPTPVAAPTTTQLEAAAMVAVDPIDTETDTTRDDSAAPRDSEIAPYALVFHEGEAWKFAVQQDGLVAMSSTTGPSALSNSECHVANVEFFCDRKISHVVCDNDATNRVIGGTYTSTGRGMWRAAWNAASEQLDDATRMFARYPEHLVNGAGNTIAQAWHGGWCVSDQENGGKQTVCVDQDKGIVGGSIATSGGGAMYIGDVPRG